MFLEIHTDRRRKTDYHYGLFRQYVSKDGKPGRRTRGKITGLSYHKLRALQEFFKKGCPSSGMQEYRITDSTEFGATHAVLEVLKSVGVDKIIYSRREPWVRHVLAMIVGRIVYQGSKLALTHLWKDTALWSLCSLGDGQPDVDDCYEAMDKLLARQTKIQKALACKHLQNGCLVLYDITSSYFEGEYADSDLVAFGYNRDRKKGHKQVVIGLMTDAKGCPVGVSVYRGNTNDQTTVADRVKELKETYSLEQVVMVGDRGMLTSARLPELSEAGLRSITALTHSQIQKLIDDKVIEPGLFDERHIAEVYDADDPKVRYMLCRNPDTAARERKTRDELIAHTRAALEALARSRKKRTSHELAAAIGAKINRWKMGKFFAWEIRRKKLYWQLDESLVEKERALDGCYVIRTDVTSCALDKDEAVARYKSLILVEQAFRMLKTVLLEIRPTYHHRDDRIESHVFVCMLAYYVTWHMRERLADLFESDGEGKSRRWTFSGVLERLKSIRDQTLVIDDTEIAIKTTPDDEQQHILDLLGVSL